MMHMHHATLTGPCVCTTLRKATRAVARLYDEALTGAGMTTAQFAILRSVARNQPIPLSRLADSLVMERTSLYRALAPIEAKGWVSVKPGQGKTRLASLTRKGRAAMEVAEADWEAAQQRITGGIGAEAWEGLSTGLRALTEFAQHAPKA